MRAGSAGQATSAGNQPAANLWTGIHPPELLALAIVLAVAAAARLISMPSRGMWDADQGHDMLVLLAWARDGVVPLVGPPTSIGELHHGALYYWLLAPAAIASDADPVWVVATIALGGIAAVAVVWWLGRSIGGPVAGLVAGGLMAVSAAAVEASTFIWNPNLIGLSSAVALAGAWRAWQTSNGRWWLVAAAGQAVTMQLHVLGAAMLVPLLALFVADLRRRRPRRRRRLVLAGVGGLVVIVVAYLPLLAHELDAGFPETRAIADVLLGRTGSEPGPNPILAVIVIAIRALSWPLAGLLTEAPIVALTVATVVAAIIGWRSFAGGREELVAARWLGWTMLWSVVVLALLAPSLATVTPGLPNDHYHAFLDPIVFVAAGLGVGAVWRDGTVTRIAAGIPLAAVVAWNVAIWPPLVAPDGGYPAAEQAAARIADDVGRDRYVMLGLPAFKPTDAVAFPLARAGLPPEPRPDTLGGDVPLVIVCDRLFEAAIGARCGGPAEDALVGSLDGGGGGPGGGGGGSLGDEWTILDRFDLSSRTTVSVYRPNA